MGERMFIEYLCNIQKEDKTNIDIKNRKEKQTNNTKRTF